MSILSTLANRTTSKWQHLLVTFLLSLAVPWCTAHAHQQKLSYTTISYNFNTDQIEIMHRFLLHDAEHAAKKLFTKDADIIADSKTRNQFSRYIENKFKLKLFPNNHIKPTMIGNETDGRYLWIYQEMPKPETIDEVEIQHGALQEIWADQVNRVNIELGANLETLIFTAEEPTQKTKIISAY